MAPIDESAEVKRFGRRFCVALGMREMTVYRFARESGLGRETIYKWCKGKCGPNYANLLQICRVLQVSADWLMGLNAPALEIFGGDERKK